MLWGTMARPRGWPLLPCMPLAADRFRPGRRGGGGTTDFWPHSFHATSIGLMLKSQAGNDAPVPPSPFRRLCLLLEQIALPTKFTAGSASCTTRIPTTSWTRPQDQRCPAGWGRGRKTCVAGRPRKLWTLAAAGTARRGRTDQCQT